MTYYVDLKLIYDRKYMKAMFGQSCPDRYIAKECTDNEGKFWRCMAVFSKHNAGFGEQYTVCTADTFSELAVWCDLHSIKPHHAECIRH